MSSDVVLPVFSDVENRTAGAALSEPFLRPDAFHVQFDREGFVPVSLGTDDLVAIGADYIEDGESTGFEYVMHPLLTTPYAGAQAFIDGYMRRIAPEQADEDRIREILSDEHIEAYRRTAIEYAKKEGLRTVGSYAVFFFQKVGYVGGVIAAKSVVNETPLKSREELMDLERYTPHLAEAHDMFASLATGTSIESVRQTKRRIAQNSRPQQQEFGLFVATLGLPRPRILRSMINAHPQVEGFLSLTRKERRELLRAERKAQPL